MKINKTLEALGFFVSSVLLAFSMLFSVMANQGKQIAFEDAVMASSGKDVFEAFKEERSRVREMEILQLTALMNDEGVEADMRALAAGEIKSLSNHMEMETTLEGILKLRGHERAVVTVHKTSVNVVVEESKMSAGERAFILDTVMRETGQTAGNVKIIGV